MLFGPFNLQFLAEAIFGIVDRDPQNVANCQEMWFVVIDDATVGRDADLAVCKGIEGIDGLVGRDTRRKLYVDFHILRSDIVYFFYFYFPLVVRLQDRIYHAGGRPSIRNIFDYKGFIIQLRDGGTHFYRATTLTIIVFLNIDKATSLKIRIECKRFFLEIGNGSITQLVEVVG